MRYSRRTRRPATPNRRPSRCTGRTCVIAELLQTAFRRSLSVREGIKKPNYRRIEIAHMRANEHGDAGYLEESNIRFNASFIVGGQIGGEPIRLFRIYAEGNFIEAGTDTPFLQTGETKYGKPILDRVMTQHTPLADATKCVLVSFDSTMRSNLSVGMPIDLLCYERDSLEVQWRRRFYD